MNLAEVIRTIPDYPKPGIMFRDITTLLADARGFRRAVDELVQPLAGAKIVLCAFVVDLPDLGGADKLRAMGKQVTSLIAFDGE